MIQDSVCGLYPQLPFTCFQPNPLRELNIDDLPQPEIPPPTTIVPEVQTFTVDADDSGFSLSEIRVARGAKVKITFNVSETNVYFAGLDFRSSKFDTGSINPGDSITVEFTADESFEFKSYWPASGVLKAIGKVVVE